MLKQGRCITHGHSISLTSRSSARSTQQHTSIRLRRATTNHSNRPLSTQSDGAPEAEIAGTPPTTEKNGLNQRTSEAQDAQAAGGSQDGSKQQFVITPRFQWRWRWHYPGSGRKKRVARKSPAQQEKMALLKREERTEIPSSNHFLPTRSEEEQNKLQSVMESISKLSEELQPPPSPLETALEDKEWKPKRQPTKEERRKLAYNPWAMILAGRLRYDAASRLRLPEPLLLPLGQVAKPGADSVYLLPDDLANLEAYDQQLRKGLRRVAMMDLPRATGGTTVNVSPYKPLIDELTGEMVVWDDKLKSGRTKNGVVAKRLVPTRWIERGQRARAYQNASKDYWDLKERLGETDEQDFKKPEVPFDVMQLQWQPNVAERMKSIMRQRLLLSIDHLGRKVDELRSRPRRHTMCFDWPESLSLDVIAESTKIPSEQQPSDDKGANYSLGAQHYRSGEPTVASHESAVIPTWTPTLTASHLLNPDTWLPGSCFLHIGPAETASTALAPSQQSATPTTEQHAPHLSNDKFTPPMLRVNNNLRLPVFNVPALLGPKFDHPLHQVLTRHGMGSPSANNTETNYIILIRATAPGYHFVVRELWQLWRYLGGTDCLKPESTETSKERQPPKTEIQKQKDRIKEYTMSKKVWDHLYTFLPGIERVSPDQEQGKEEVKKAQEEEGKP